ncbi:MAG: hypothetical protein K2X48_19680 [Chitinophagaceae bacterium]|nr:hypothetical protein [Chitinophagaceae bacterium]
MITLKNDIEDALRRYPMLYLKQINDEYFLQGNFIACDVKSKIEIDRFEILLGFTKNYPYRFPIVWELSNKIPKTLDRHIKNDGTLCFSNLQEELRFCKNGITLIDFLQKVLNPHLCREYYREKEGVYPTGERAHGLEGGIWQEYYEIFDTQDKAKILEEIEMILTHKSIGRNSLCYCNRGKIYKACHEKIEPKILDIGMKNVIWILGLLKEDYKGNTN